MFVFMYYLPIVCIRVTVWSYIFIDGLSVIVFVCNSFCWSCWTSFSCFVKVFSIVIKISGILQGVASICQIEESNLKTLQKDY